MAHSTKFFGKLERRVVDRVNSITRKLIEKGAGDYVKGVDSVVRKLIEKGVEG